MNETTRGRVARRARGLKSTIKKQQRRFRDVSDLGRQVARLRTRLADLENEVQENRRLNRRIAELTDVVQELLLPAEMRDEEKIRARLNDYHPGRWGA